MGIKQAKALYVRPRSLNVNLGKEELLRDFKKGHSMMTAV